jgi:hypothetical protein
MDSTSILELEKVPQGTLLFLLLLFRLLLPLLTIQIIIIVSLPTNKNELRKKLKITAMQKFGD